MAKPAEGRATLVPNYLGRTGSSLLALVLVLVAEWSRPHGTAFWVVVVVGTLGWPHVA
jgi:hypothetical protein